MIFPLKIFTTKESFLQVVITIPLWFKIKEGFKPDRVIKDRWFHPQITCMTGDEVNCLHTYAIQWRFRIRSNDIMKKLNPGSDRCIFYFKMGWGQVFETAII